MKLLPVGAEFFHAERRTDIHNESCSRFRNFANSPEIALGLIRKILAVLATRIKLPWINTEVYLQNEQFPAVFPSRSQRLQPSPVSSFAQYIMTGDT